MIETVEKRDRRLATMRRETAAFRRSLGIFSPYEALKYIGGLQVTWNAVRRVATELVHHRVADVGTAWAICQFVNGLGDGKTRMKAAVERALIVWEEESSDG